MAAGMAATRWTAGWQPARRRERHGQPVAHDSPRPALSPEFRRGLPGTLLLALVATAGRVIVPVTVQQTIDRGLLAGRPGRPGAHPAVRAHGRAGDRLTAVAAYAMNVRLYRTTESGLATLRTRAFRHVHDLSILTQNAERRGSMVSRVTSDVDTISTFMQWGGVLLIVSLGQLTVATVLMALLLLAADAAGLGVLLAPVPAAAHVPASGHHGVRRRPRADGRDARCGLESVVGASVVRAYAIEDRTAERIDAAVSRTAGLDSRRRPWSR